MTTLHVVSHTHWDREWYRTFQEFRFRLVGLVDRLLDLLEHNPEYRHFTLDGQTILLDDYLAIRPEQEGRIARLVREGRLLVGPWYVLPDEFLQGPEAMVRNLLFGRRGCRRFTDETQPMERIGYLPDPFGHIGQLPQIASGFGMDALCFWRGVGDAPTEVQWAAPDGTECLVLHLRNSYGNGARLAGDEDGFVRDIGVERDRLAPHATTSHLLIMQGTDHMEPRPDLPDRLWAATERARSETSPSVILHSTLPAYLQAVRSELGDDGLAALPRLRGELRSAERAHLLPAVLSARMWIKQRNARCEELLTRWAEPVAALAEALAEPPAPDMRGFLREAWQWLLQNHPHDSICGCSVDQVHREMRTRFDWSEQLAEQVIAAGLESIAASVALSHAGEGVRSETSPSGRATAIDEGSRILVVNTCPFPRTDLVRVHLPAIPAGPWHLRDVRGEAVPCRAVRPIEREHYNERMLRERFAAFLADAVSGRGAHAGEFRVEAIETAVDGRVLSLEVRVATAGGAPVAPSEEGPGLEQILALLDEAAVEGYHLRVVEDDGLEIEFLARDVPGLGYSELVVADGHAHTLEPSEWPALEGASPGLQAREELLCIENEFLAVEVDPDDGTLTVRDKVSGLELRGANRFSDGGDRGDEYTFCPPEEDVVIDRPALRPAIRRVDSPVGSTLEIDLVYRVPRALAADDRSSRSHDRVDLPIECRVTLVPGVGRVDIETVVENRAEDHRLRVLFATSIQTDRSWAEGHFDVVERALALPQGTAAWAEQPVGTHPQLGWVDVSDGERGVLLANQGLPEYEALPGDDGAGVTLALTLLRCVGWLSRGDLHTRSGHAGPALPTPEAQCPGRHTFRYALVPHAGNYLSGHRQAQAFGTPLRAIVVAAGAGRATTRGAPTARTLLEIMPGAIVLSALKVPEEGRGLIVRVFNSAPVPVVARLRLWRPFHEAAQVRMDESVTLRTLASDTDVIDLPLRAKEIATLRVTL